MQRSETDQRYFPSSSRWFYPLIALLLRSPEQDTNISNNFKQIETRFPACIQTADRLFHYIFLVTVFILNFIFHYEIV